MQYLSLRCLWVSKIHHLIQQLVNDNEVVPYALLLQLLEVLGEDIDDFVEEKEDLGGVRISFRESEEVEVVVADVQILYESN